MKRKIIRYAYKRKERYSFGAREVTRWKLEMEDVRWKKADGGRYNP